VFLLAHLSDPHLAPLPPPRLGELASKRLLGYLNWVRKRHAIHRRDVVAAIVADLHAAKPDHIAVTGDLVNIALPTEIANAAHWLETLGPPAQVSLVPGNHDAYVPGAAGRCVQVWAPYMAGDAVDTAVDGAAKARALRDRGAASPSPRVRGEGRGEGASPHAGASEAQTRGAASSPVALPRADLSPNAGRGDPEREESHETDRLQQATSRDEAFPFLRVRGPVALIGVSTAVATGPFLATGTLGARQIAAMSALLAATADRFRIVLIHHPPHVAPKSSFKRLVDAAAFRDAIATAGAELVIHGHDHVRSLAYIDGPQARVPVIGVPSASAAFGKDHDAAGYNLYRIDGRPGAWMCAVERRGLDAHGAVTVCERFTV
jgi:3',5'-cyclic AMP phosphodiesterase CpdA